MKYIILVLFVAVANATPHEDNGPVELILNGVDEGQPLDLSNVLDIKLKEHSNGEVVATNLLHQFTAAGMAEAVVPEPVVLPPPVAPEVYEPVVLPSPVPEPVVLPPPVAPEVVPVPDPVVLPEPVVLPPPVAPEVIAPEPVVLPPPVAPEVIAPEPVVLPPPVAPEVVLPNGEVYNDGTVSLTVNTPQEAGVLSTIQTWFSLVLNYINGEAHTSHQIV